MFGGNYNVKLRVGIFPKKGKLELRVMDGNLVSAYLDIFNKSNPLQGTIENGTIDIHGMIKLPVGETEYEAIGTVEGNTIKLKFDTKFGFYKMTGTRM